MQDNRAERWPEAWRGAVQCAERLVVRHCCGTQRQEEAGRNCWVCLTSPALAYFISRILIINNNKTYKYL